MNPKYEKQDRQTQGGEKQKTKGNDRPSKETKGKITDIKTLNYKDPKGVLTPLRPQRRS
jgi:hypothetical protein